jgi:hypothetical protein
MPNMMDAWGDSFPPINLHNMPTKGTKYDNNKPKMDLLDWSALEGLARVLTFGASKYEPNNWRSGIVNSRLIASLLRHLAAIQRGEDIDPESGLPHIDHLGCNWLFLSYNFKHRPDLDDRWGTNDAAGQDKSNYPVLNQEAVKHLEEWAFDRD